MTRTAGRAPCPREPHDCFRSICPYCTQILFVRHSGLGLDMARDLRWPEHEVPQHWGYQRSCPYSGVLHSHTNP